MMGADALARALSIRDLTDPAQGPHAMQLLVRGAADALRSAWGCKVLVHRGSPIVDTSDNYDRLHYDPGSVARDARYTRYVSPGQVLRTHTSAMIPPLLRTLGAVDDRLLVCAGLVYRRDCIDRLHTGEPHQLDLWRVRRAPERLRRPDLLAMIAHVVGALLPGRTWRSSETTHPYTEAGLQIDVLDAEAWVEIGECGLALPALLDEAGRSSRDESGLAMGLGLDRILMLRKGMGDIRLLRSHDPRVAVQMQDLSPYRPVSSMPPVRRDLSIVVAADAEGEELGDQVRAALGDRASSVESVQILSETPYESLPPAAVVRLGIGRGQKNVLLRVVLRDLERTLTHEEANTLRDAIYAALHQGTAYEWASRSSSWR
jgi:phenylalanyl-tRNA synthetase alpha chain